MRKVHEDMKCGLLKSNEAAFVSILSSCTCLDVVIQLVCVRLVDFGFQLFEAMSREFGFVARMEHYGCVVYLSGRVGLLQEAYDFIKKMPFEADATVLGALWVLVDFMECAFSSIYAGAERWNHAVSLRKAMLDAGIQKVPAHSFI
uniref:Pentatricopeptide repeat-containing protein n=1 Tax=Solanum lycopersicum TaxID=4081 RepID=A0A3Q7ES96_SOLLC